MDSVFHIFSQKNRSILRYFSAKSNGFRSNSDNSLAERRCLSGSLLCIINQNANGIGNIQHAIFIDIRTLFLCRIKLCFIACCNPSEQQLHRKHQSFHHHQYHHQYLQHSGNSRFQSASLQLLRDRLRSGAHLHLQY